MSKKKRILILLFFPFLVLLYITNLNIKKSYSEPSNLSGFELAKDYFKKGFIQFNMMRYLSAVEFFRDAVAEYPEYYTAREYLARSYKLAGFIPEAVKEWENLADMTSNNVSILNKLDSLQYKDSSGIQQKLSAGEIEFVYSNSYTPLNLGRFRISKPIDLAVDAERNIYITSFSTGKLVKLDSNGDGISVFNRGVDTRFYGVDVHSDRVCVSDFKNDIIYILDSDLNLIKSFGESGKEDGKFHGPEGLSFDDAENIYVVDSGNHRVQKFDRDGNFILKFGRYGEYESQLNSPSHLYIDSKIIYVSDTGNKRIATFDESGNFIKNILIDGLESPRGISGYYNNIIVSDETKGLLFYSIENNKSFWLNSWDNAEKKFSKLVSAQPDRDGVLYCLDYNQDSIFVFSPIQSVYSNVEIEVTSIDTGKYPVIACYLNVRNRNGNPVYNLKKSNFKLTEDNANIPNLYVDYLKNENPSVSAVLCIDRSNKNMGYHNEIPWIADFVLKKMKKTDSVQVLNYNKDSWVGNDFDWSRRRTIKELRKRNYADGKAVDKALYNAVSDLLLKTNRRGVFLITDGTLLNDSFERYTPEIIIDYAKSHFIPIYIVVFKEKNSTLKRIAEETGGAIFKASEVEGLRSIYNNIKESEEYRYVVVYSTFRSPLIKGWWSDIKIEINDKGHRGVEWAGYFVP